MKNKSLLAVLAGICITLLIVMIPGSVSMADGGTSDPPIPSPSSTDTTVTGGTSSVDDPVEVIEVTQMEMSIADYIIIAVDAIL